MNALYKIKTLLAAAKLSATAWNTKIFFKTGVAGWHLKPAQGVA